MMMPLPLQSIGHLFITRDSLKSSALWSLLQEKMGLHLMMDLWKGVLPSWSSQFFQWTMRKGKGLFIIYQSYNWAYIRARAAAIFGANSQFTCLSCLVPKEFLCDLPGDIYPLRTRNGTLTLLARAEECGTKAEAYKILLEQSVRNIPVSLISTLGEINTKVYLTLNSRILSWITSATTCVFTSLSALIPSIRLSRGYGDNISGSGSRMSISQLLNSEN